ncbi:MAG: Holliday junction branch migration protein RuvA [Planctomycetes bacterium]|nr:Holliday junction branch migration protein RuvA [Planctomycetota bacterium]HPF14451.1 Holliday junction branch migration protein RuvA [Planctomycetota bacterium]HRV81984.1 Holliday junction branch migration protein RuvA [Planctomycetota bacterium]
MFDFFEGQVASRKAASLALLVGGVGYDLRVPLGVPMPAIGSKARFFVHLAVREDAHTLYGFPDESLRDLFRLLLKVRGVGPSMALAVLSGLSREEFLQAVLRDDAKTLQAIKGVGKKTAEQILLDLKDKAQSLASGPGHPSQPQGGPPRVDNVEDAIGALISIGYSEKEAKLRVERAAQSIDPSDLEALVRAAIQT